MELRQQHINLARTLPKRLLDFFRKYPPPALTQGLPSTSTSTSTAAAPIASDAGNATPASSTASTDPNVPSLETPASDESTYRNPFQPHKNFATGRWHSPAYGLRRQAELVKSAQEHGVVQLLPYTIKLPGERLRRRLEQGLRIKGTGVGQQVKGKIWERTMKGRLEKRKQAMLGMPAMIREWQKVCFCKGGLGCGVLANCFVGWTWKGLEEVAEINGFYLVGICHGYGRLWVRYGMNEILSSLRRRLCTNIAVCRVIVCIWEFAVYFSRLCIILKGLQQEKFISVTEFLILLMRAAKFRPK